MNKISPVGDKIFVKRRKVEEITKSGIIISSSPREISWEGDIVALGKGKLLQDGSFVDFKVKVGDRILFSKRARNEIEVEEQKYLILTEYDILAIIEE